jgi:O-antigen biosynthesis protein WbqP
MSFVAPRPALWNQYDLIARRDEQGAGGVRPGLTGWAQV